MTHYGCDSARKFKKFGRSAFNSPAATPTARRQENAKKNFYREAKTHKRSKVRALAKKYFEALAPVKSKKGARLFFAQIDERARPLRLEN